MDLKENLTVMILVLVSHVNAPYCLGSVDVGAGFYLNATLEPWNGHWKMYDYVTSELPEVLKNNFDKLDVSNVSIMGHSMGGHGALTIFLKNPNKFKSVSAFSPVVHPMQVPWGTKGAQTNINSQVSVMINCSVCRLLGD